MIVNYVPGEECRVAIVENGKLEELHVERFAAASRVGNIYVGKVMNVEPAIQAAFVDFGVGDNGFLHVSDLHPRYFPGESEETTESVGHKTPRRERPPIQAALRRGDEVIVQVLKEGVGTKGPTLTSYLSIPGRFLVMMPGMDRVGVSRKVEDEEQRRAMREILDDLDLPDGFGFIVRTAGMERNKTELKRDLAYLVRLWKDMERRQKSGDKPRLLYSESDLFVRSLRDILTTDIQEVVVDNDRALHRAAAFLKIVSPRGGTKLLHFPGTAPIFHAFGIEQQIAMIHAREVPLHSGGRLVIDQTEAIVAIDVNSGKSRDARDAEENAYQTNLEAVDEICRQLRLRDLGGIVINDLIDMRSMAHRREVENRFKERLKRDRAKSTVAGISQFGILEMTRQRMRGSHESVHFTDCPTCRGRGVVQRPDSVSADALRELASLLDVERIAKIELVVAPRIAGELLSTKRRLLTRIEKQSGKHIDVRVSDALAVDRVTFYAYAADGSDIELGNLPMPKTPSNLVEFDLGLSEDPGVWDEQEAPQSDEYDDEETVDDGFGAPHPIEAEESGDAPEGNLDPTLGVQTGRRAKRGGRSGGARDDRGGRGGGGGGGGGRGDGRSDGRSDQPRRERPRDPGLRPDGTRFDPRTEPQSRQDQRQTDQRQPEQRQAEQRRPDPRQSDQRQSDRHAPRPPARSAPPPIPGQPLPPGDHGDGDSSYMEPAARGPQDQYDESHNDPYENGPNDGESNAQGDGPGGDAHGEGQNGDGPPGEGGRRRRRRRRRRGGRGGAGGPAGGELLPDGTRNFERGPDGEPLPAPTSDAEYADGSSGEGDSAPAMNAGDHGESEFEGQPRAGEVGSDEHGTGGQGEGGRRRRRRRRRGRGRGGAGPDGQMAGGPESDPGADQHAPQAREPQPRDDRPRDDRPRENRDGYRGDSPRNDRRPEESRPAPRDDQFREPRPPAPRAQPPRTQAPRSTPPQAPAAPAPAADKPRTLYRNFRKLSPSERNKRPKPE